MTRGNLLTASRLNFLYQSAHVAIENSKKTGKYSKKEARNKKVVANYYTQLMISIGQKSVQRLSKDLKRTICKGCRNILVPGSNCKVIIKSKPVKKFGSICDTCKTEKVFPIKVKKPTTRIPKLKVKKDTKNKVNPKQKQNPSK